MLDIGFVVAASVVAFLIRLLVRRQAWDAIATDTYFHWALARQIRDDGHRVLLRMPRLSPTPSVSPRTAYPYFFHWALSFFSEKTVERIEPYLSPLADALHVLTVGLLGLRLLGMAGLEEAASAAAWASVLVATAPGFLRVGIGPRAYNASPRPWGQLFTMLFTLEAVAWRVGGRPVDAIAAVLATAAASVTSKFANQFVLFVSLFLLLWGISEPALLALGGFAVALVLTRGKAYWVWHDQIAHSVFYVRYLQKAYAHSIHRPAKEYLRKVYGALRWPRTHLRPFLAGFWRERWWGHLLAVCFPQLPLLLILIVLPQTSASPLHALALGELLPWVLAGLLCTALTATRPLSFLGEPERYTESTLGLQMLAVAALAVGADLEWLLAVLLLYAVVAYVGFYRLYPHVIGSQYRRLIPGLVAPFDQDANRVFALGYFPWVLLYEMRAARLVNPGVNLIEPEFVRYEEWRPLWGRFPLPAEPLEESCRRSAITHIVAEQHAIQAHERETGDTSFADGRFRKLAEAGQFAVFSTGIAPSAAGAEASENGAPAGREPNAPASSV